jgi:molybdate transport system permease protein
MPIRLAWRGLATDTVRDFTRALLAVFGATMMVAGSILGLTQTASLSIYDNIQTGAPARAGWLTPWISLVSIAALWLVQRTLPDRGSIH